MNPAVIVALCTLSAGVVSALVTYLLGRRKAVVEPRKLEAEVAEAIAATYSSLVDDLSERLKCLRVRIERLESNEKTLQAEVDALRKRVAELEKENALLVLENKRLRDSL